MPTFGKMPTKKPKGYFKAVEFPVLALLDTKTGDRRLLSAKGAETRALPLTIKFATKTSYGHEGAEVSGTLFEVTIDDGKMSGKGFLLDDENGRRHARLIHLGALRGNSVDLADVQAKFVEDLDTGDYWVEFAKFKLAATTGVATPAFAEAHAVVEPLDDDELVAAMAADPMLPLVCTFDDFDVNVLGLADAELTASAQAVAFADFYTPEAPKPQKLVVTGDGKVHGHLALWNTCHDGFADRCFTVPRPQDGYASFNKAGVLTERGQIETGPIFALGGHRPARSAATIEDAYGGIENAWCDVRVVEGRHGPWLSGRVRPGVGDDIVYAARASRISGHWVNGKLKAIVSVNAEGFEVPGTGGELELVAAFATTFNDDGVSELWASLPGCVDEEPLSVTNQLTLMFPSDLDASAVASAISSALSGSVGYVSVTPTMTTATSMTTNITNVALVADDEEPTTPGEVPDTWAQDALRRALDGDDSDED